jgi:hypothetical protein
MLAEAGCRWLVVVLETFIGTVGECPKILTKQRSSSKEAVLRVTTGVATSSRN